MPEFFIAARGDPRELVVVQTASGLKVRTLVDFDDWPSDGDQTQTTYPPEIDGMALTPDARTVYFGTHIYSRDGTGPPTWSLYSIPVAGGEPLFVTNGVRPAVSADGRHLAYRVVESVEVREIATGKTRRYEGPPRGDYAEVSGLTWAPDGGHLVVRVSGEGSSDLRVLDLGMASLADARVVPMGPDVVLPAFPAYRTFDGLVGVLCCPGPDGGDIPDDVFAVIDPASGKTRGRLELPFDGWGFAYDRSGRHQLFVTSDRTVQRRSGGPFTPVPELSEVHLVAW